MEIKIVEDPFEGEVIKAIGSKEKGDKPFIAEIINPDPVFKYKRKFLGNTIEYEDGKLEVLVQIKKLQDQALLDIRHKGERGYFIFYKDPKGVEPIKEGDLRKILLKNLKSKENKKVVELSR